MYEWRDLFLTCDKNSRLGFDTCRSSQFRLRIAVLSVRVHDILAGQSCLLHMNEYSRRQFPIVDRNPDIGAKASGHARSIGNSFLQLSCPIRLEFVSGRVLFPRFWHDEVNLSARTQGRTKWNEPTLRNELGSKLRDNAYQELFFFLQRHASESNDAQPHRKITEEENYLEP
jgi:hypothetical protein